MTKKKKKNSKRKLNKKRLYTFIISLIFLVFISYKLFNTNIKNIYISGNNFLNDQDILDISLLSDYPKTIKNLSFSIEKRLKENIYILDAKVTKRNFFTSVYIEIKENYPLFFYQTDNKTVLYDGKKVSEKFSIPTVINQIPNTIYDKFLSSMKKTNKDVLYRMSEIQYLPNDVDSERFFILMNDGNYVYITLNKFTTINKYVEMIKSFDNKKGVLYLDSGVYFDIFD